MTRVRRRVLQVGGRRSVYVLTRTCRNRRVLRMTSCAKSSCNLDMRTSGESYDNIVVYNIHFVTRAYGVLDPGGEM